MALGSQVKNIEENSNRMASVAVFFNEEILNRNPGLGLLYLKKHFIILTHDTLCFHTYITHPHIEDSIFIHWSYLKWRAWHFYGRNSNNLYSYTDVHPEQYQRIWNISRLIHSLKLLWSSQLHKKGKCPNSTKEEKSMKLVCSVCSTR